MPSDSNPASGPLHPREFLILLALADGPRHGYAILKAIDAESDGEVQFDPANLYRTLKRLLRDGLVSETRTRAGDRRRSFALTPDGRRVVGAEAARVRRLAATARVRKLALRAGSMP